MLLESPVASPLQDSLILQCQPRGPKSTRTSVERLAVCRANLRRSLQLAELIRLRFGLTDDGAQRTLEEVGAFFNVTRERIRQIEAKALRKLRQAHRTGALRAFYDGSN